MAKHQCAAASRMLNKRLVASQCWMKSVERDPQSDPNQMYKCLSVNLFNRKNNISICISRNGCECERMRLDCWERDWRDVCVDCGWWQWWRYKCKMRIISKSRNLTRYALVRIRRKIQSEHWAWASSWYVCARSHVRVNAKSYVMRAIAEQNKKKEREWIHPYLLQITSHTLWLIYRRAWNTSF